MQHQRHRVSGCLAGHEHVVRRRHAVGDGVLEQGHVEVVVPCNAAARCRNRTGSGRV